MLAVTVRAETEYQYPMFPTHSSIKALKEMVSPPLYESLEGIWRLAKNEVLVPLSLVEREDDFWIRVENFLPRFSRQRLAILLLLLSYYKDNLNRFKDEMNQIFSLFDEDIDRRAKRYFKDSEILTLRSVIHTVRGVNRRIIQWVMDGGYESLAAEKKGPGRESQVEELYQNTVRLDLCLSFIFSVFEKEIKPLNNRVLAACLDKADEYATRYFCLAKSVGILSSRRKPEVSFPGDLTLEELEEDRELAEAGLEEYVRLLGREDGSEEV